MNRRIYILVLVALAASVTVAQLHTASHALVGLHGNADLFDASDHPARSHVEAPAAPDPADCLSCLLVPRCRDPFTAVQDGLPLPDCSGFDPIGLANRLDTIALLRPVPRGPPPPPAVS